MGTTVMIDTKTTWNNCYADVLSSSNPLIIARYLRDVIEPSLLKLHTDLHEIDPSIPTLRAFMEADAKFIIKTTMESFCLSLDSIWERQITSYLKRYLQDITPNENMGSANWVKVQEIFKKTRAIEMSNFDSYDSLNLLRLLANVYRHGAGRSFDTLQEQYPNILNIPNIPSMPGMNGDATNYLPTPDNLGITLDWLQHFANSIESFWDDCYRIYLHSLNGKREGVMDTARNIKNKQLERGIKQEFERLFR